MKRWRRTRAPARTGGHLLIVCVVFIALAVWMDGQLRPVIESITVNEARNVSINTINDAVLQELNKGSVSYTDLVQVERGTDGKVLAITTDMVCMNKLKAAVLEDVRQELGNYADNKDVAIPLGTLLGNELLHGRGPKIPLRLTLSGNVTADFESSFTSAGVNQTKHQIYLKVRTSVYSFLPGFNTTTDIQTNVPVAETIIVGEVPQVVANLK